MIWTGQFQRAIMKLKEGFPMNTNRSSNVLWVLIAVLVVLFAVSLGWFLYANSQAGQESWQLVGNGIILSIPLLLFYVSIGLLLTAARQRSSQGQINPRLARFIFLAPRVAGILIILFVAMFSLDVFDMGGSFWEMLGAFLIHSLPSIVLGILMVLAWRRPVIGFIAFGLMALVFLRFVIGNPLFGFGNFLLFTCPMAAVALLFWANWKWKDMLSGGNHKEG
jgi:hypothetical protein